MNSKIAIFIFVASFCNPITSGAPVMDEDVGGYYWRNYNGNIPGDAIAAGRDLSGKHIYIGQGFFLNEGLLVGTLYEGSNELRVTHDRSVHTTNRFIKILCSRSPRNFRWIPVKYSDIASLTTVHLVEGGVETNSVLHIGRARHEGDLAVGKVYNLTPDVGLTLPNHQGRSTIYKNFDILTYDFDLIDLPSQSIRVNVN